MCGFGAKAAFRSSKSFLETHDSFLRWFDPRMLFTSFKSPLMMFTASTNVEDSHDALSSTVDCATTSKDKNVISTQITKVKIKAEERASDMLVEGLGQNTARK